MTGKNYASAMKYRGAGLSPIPISDARNSEGRLMKTPYSSVLPQVNGVGSWAPFQDRRPTDDEMKRFWSNGALVAVTCGKASGNLEVIDFDIIGYYDAWRALVDQELLERLVVMTTPSGGHHVWYRTQDVPEGNKKLAMDREGHTAIETRGHGGYVLCAPSTGYKKIQGKITEIPVLSDDEREDLINAARMLNQKHETPRDYAKTATPAITRPGDRYARENTWYDILTALGWKHSHERGGNTYWTRPGKNKGVSGSTNGEDGYFYCFTSNAPGLEPSTAYTKFGLYTAANFGGDHYAAAQYLNKETPKARNERETYIEQTKDYKRQWVLMSDVKPGRINCLVDPYFPEDAVTVAFGDSGIGKSTATIAIASALSRGMGFPNGEKRDPINVIYLSAEDPAETVIAPRLIKLEADLNRFMVPREHDEFGLSNPLKLDDEGCAELADQITDFGAKLVIIDPLRAYFQALADINSQTDARTFMRRLGQIAAKCHCAIVLIHHQNKSTSSSAKDRASGSKDFIDASRSAIYFVQDAEDESKCAFMHIKHNYTYKGKTLGYTITHNPNDKDDWQFGWTGESELTESDAVYEPKKASKVTKGAIEHAKEWILETLTNEGEVSAIEMYQGAKLEGINAASIKRAKEDLRDKVRSNKQKDGSWTWSLKATAPNWWGDKEDPYYEP